MLRMGTDGNLGELKGLKKNNMFQLKNFDHF